MKFSVSIELDFNGDAMASPYLEWEITRIFDEIVTPYVKNVFHYNQSGQRALFDLSGSCCGRLEVEILDPDDEPR